MQHYPEEKIMSNDVVVGCRCVVNVKTPVLEGQEDPLTGRVFAINSGFVMIQVDDGNRGVIIPWSNVIMAEVWDDESTK